MLTITVLPVKEKGDDIIFLRKIVKGTARIKVTESRLQGLQVFRSQLQTGQKRS